MGVIIQGGTENDENPIEVATTNRTGEPGLVSHKLAIDEPILADEIPIEPSTPSEPNSPLGQTSVDQATIGRLIATQPGEELTNLPDSIAWDFRPRPGSDELVITLSPSKTFLMSQTAFERNVLLMTDKKGSYYTFKASYIVKVLLEFIATKNFSKVLFIGSSKGGYGALLYAGYCAQRDKRRAYYSLAFSPQISIYPPNPHLENLPSYMGLLTRLAKNRGLEISVQRSPDVHLVEWVRNLHVVIVYSEMYEQDVKEAARLCAANIRKYPVPFTLHASIMPLNMRGQNEPDVLQRIKVLYRTKSSDADLEATLPDEWMDLVDWIVGNTWIPSVVDLVNETMSVEVDLSGLPTPRLQKA